MVGIRPQPRRPTHPLAAVEVRFAAHDERPTPIDSLGRSATCLIRVGGNLMGGFAVDIDWDNPSPHGRLDAMLALIPHRSTGGTSHSLLPHAALGEARTDEATRQPSIVTDGRFSIVGDLRLWSKDGLRARAGGNRTTVGMDDRRLLIAAYSRTGIGFLDDVDGDFAFVIWDSQRRRVLAVRDRFAAKPLCYERTSTGIRLATEAKQLVATSSRQPTPNDAAVTEYLLGRYRDVRHTFFEGVSRVAPAHYLLVDETRLIEHEYWMPDFEPTMLDGPDEVADEFRERLIDSVVRRTRASHGTVAHLSGGLDSSSITSAAAIAAGRTQLSQDFQTVSAIFPGSTADESQWINEIAAAQPFVHHDFVPERETIENAEEVMWKADGPLHNRIRGIWKGTADIARAAAADLVLMGSGGDEAVEQAQLLPDLLRQGAIGQWRKGVHAEAAWFNEPAAFFAERSLRLAAPGWIKRPFRGYVDRSIRSRASLASDTLVTHGPSTYPDHRAAPSATQQLAVSAPRGPMRCLLNEVQEAEYAATGVGVSYPFLDRMLLEFVASIAPATRPFDGSAKALTRQAFKADLPRSVLERRAKTAADGYLANAFEAIAAGYQRRYPTATDVAATYLDRSRYAAATASLWAGAILPAEREALWNAWTLMHWIEGLGRYRADRRSIPADDRDAG